MKKAILVIAQEGFQDREFSVTRDILVKGNIALTVAAISLSPATGALGSKVVPDIALNKASAKDYDAVVFIGGHGAVEHWDEPAAHRLAKEVYAQGGLAAAICIAPVTLAKAGILRAKRATVFPEETAEIKKYGAVYTASGVERDGRVITASGPAAAEKFAETILEALLTE